MTKKDLPKYVYADRGYVRFIRRSRGQSVMMHEAPGTPEFWEHYNRLLKGHTPAPTISRRTFRALADSYFRSDAFKQRKPNTKRDYQKYIGFILEVWGDKDPAKIETRHIYELQMANADHWRKANYLVQVMVVLMNHARLIGYLKKGHDNPAKGIPLFKQKSEGWIAWPDDVMEEFERIAPARARLVYELCLGTGQRIGDVLKMRWSDIKDGTVYLTQGKGEKPMDIPLTDRLKAHLATVEKKGLAVVGDKHGRPVRYHTIAAEMRKVKASMKHPDAPLYQTHGLRRNATMELYLAGCDDSKVQAVTGHSGVEMLKKYGGAVRQRELASQAQTARNLWEQSRREP